MHIGTQITQIYTDYFATEGTENGEVESPDRF